MLQIINLPARRDRRRFMETSCAAPLRDIGVDVSFVAADDAAAHATTPTKAGFALDDAALDALLDDWHRGGCEPVARCALERYYSRPPSPAEAACTASHRRAWRRATDAMAANSKLHWVMILEDDAARRPSGRHQHANAATTIETGTSSRRVLSVAPSPSVLAVLRPSR